MHRDFLLCVPKFGKKQTKQNSKKQKRSETIISINSGVAGVSSVIGLYRV